MSTLFKTFLDKSIYGPIDIMENEYYSKVPRASGVYIIVSKKVSFLYPGGKSRVIYIGSAINLKKRLVTHRRNLRAIDTGKKEKFSVLHYSRYQYIKKFGGRIYWIRPKGTQEAKNLESDIICSFYDRYLAVPVGNGAFSFRKEKY